GRTSAPVRGSIGRVATAGTISTAGGTGMPASGGGVGVSGAGPAGWSGAGAPPAGGAAACVVASTFVPGLAVPAAEKQIVLLFWTTRSPPSTRRPESRTRSHTRFGVPTGTVKRYR